MVVLRAISLSLLHGADYLKYSLGRWFVALVVGLAGWSAGGGLLKGLGIGLTLLSLLFLALRLSARWQRAAGIRRLAGQVCPVCGTRMGREASSMAFAAYTQRCREFVQASRCSFIDFQPPLHLVCHQCSRPLFYDYMETGELCVADEDDGEAVDASAMTAAATRPSSKAD